MAHLTISNIGPIKSISLELNRFNVFIGPQGCGKSTVAKIVSFCQWLEKDCLKHQMTSHIDSNFINSNLLEYHNMEGYFSESSYFKFSSEATDIVYSNKELHVTRREKFCTAPISKNAYIPAERNVISVPGIFSTKMPDNYILDFIDTWLNVRDKYRNGEKVALLDLNQFYSYDEKEKKDIVSSADNKFSFQLSQVSSGLQSVTPLCVMVDYLTSWIYVHEEEKSAEERRYLREAAAARFIADKQGLDDVLDVTRLNESLRPSLDTLVKTMQSILDREEMAEEGDDIKKLRQIERTLSSPSFSNIVIEEPELNLFPTTQIRLVYYLLSKINHSRDQLVLTTHSPYVLYAFNNCLLAAKTSGNAEVPVDELTGIPASAWVNPNNVSVWELENGIVRNDRTIQDENGLIRDNYFDRIMNNIMVDFRNLLNFLPE